MANLLGGAEIVGMTEGLISGKKQQGVFSIDLTVQAISMVSRGGALDFGGSEYQEASLLPLEAEKKTPDQPYGWWDLASGDYLVFYNEEIKIASPGLIVIFPNQRLLSAGASHASLVLANFDQKTCAQIHVGPQGLKIKQNARISTAIVIINT